MTSDPTSEPTLTELIGAAPIGPGEQLDLLLRPQDLHDALEYDARTGLTATPKWLPPKYFYDDRGSALFEEITRLDEYYPTRTEHAILTEHADEIARAAGAEALVELGSGSSEKTRLLLDAMLGQQSRLAAYIPVDVSAGALRAAMAVLRQDYPELELHGAVADFDRDLDKLPAPGTRLIALLGSTIGNYPAGPRQVFLAAVAASMKPGESLLLGLDLVKDPTRLIAAYDDAAHVTAEFNRNVLRVLDRELDGDLDPTDFDHVAVWDPDNEQIEMRLRARRDLTAHLRALGLDIGFAAGEELRTEISAKFRRARIEHELTDAGLELEQWWTDPAGDFALLLARR